MSKLIDLTGRRFGSWRVLQRATRGNPPMWLCLCQCGRKRKVLGANLRSGATTSCGCKRRYPIAHGHSRRDARTSTYSAWHHMHVRCRANYEKAKDYFERGIRVCDRWSDFSLFLADMGERPKGLRLDRIDHDVSYQPSNCRWASPAVQRRNTRRVSLVDVDGQKLPLADAAALVGISDSAVYQDRWRRGGTLQDAFDRVRERKLR